MPKKGFRSGETVYNSKGREGMVVRPHGNGFIEVRWKDNDSDEAIHASKLRIDATKPKHGGNK